MYAAYIERVVKPYTGRTYDVTDYASSILPNANQMFYSLYMTGIEQLGISYKKEYLVLHVRDGKRCIISASGICRHIHISIRS